MGAERVCVCKNSLHHLMGRGEGGFLMKKMIQVDRDNMKVGLRKKKEFVPFRRKDL